MKIANKISTAHCITWLSLIYITALWLIPGIVLAAPWDDATDGVIDEFNSGFARSLAILAVIGLGTAGFFGKLSWRWAGGIICGIVLVFGSTAIVDLATSWVS